MTPAAPSLRPVAADGPLWRIGRRPDPWAWAPWSAAGPDGTFGNRYDDPRGAYRVLYASSTAFGAFVETLARFRPDLEVLAALDEIEGEDDDPPTAPAGVLPHEWLARRSLGTADVAGMFCDIGHAASLAHLRVALAPLFVAHGLDDLDAGDVRARAPRALTQALSRYVFVAHGDGGGPFAGIRYASRLGDDLTNWAVFEGSPVAGARGAAIAPDDPDLVRALRHHGITLGP